MTPPPELAKCSNCDCWFTVAATDEVFHHATRRCCPSSGTSRAAARELQPAVEPALHR